MRRKFGCARGACSRNAEAFREADEIEIGTAEIVVQGLADERFLILPHPEVAEYFRRKASDYDRWLRGMRRLRASVVQQH